MTQNILTTKIQSSIGKTQEGYGIKILCRAFYQEVLDVIDGTTTSAVIDTLLPFLRDFLVFKIYEDYVSISDALSTPAGFRTSIDTTSEPISSDAMNRLIGNAHQWAVYYQDQLVNFLTLNADDYPTWEDSICGCDDKRRTENNNQFSLIGRNKRATRIDWT